jgi:hypothetical protein
MILHKSLFLGPAILAGIKVPPDFKLWNEMIDRLANDPNVPSLPLPPEVADYPHWWQYFAIQQSLPNPFGNYLENAKTVAAIPDDKILDMTILEILALGVR